MGAKGREGLDASVNVGQENLGVECQCGRASMCDFYAGDLRYKRQTEVSGIPNSDAAPILPQSEQFTAMY